MNANRQAWIERARSVRIEDELTRRNIKLNGKTERAGPCPVCGGTDRFSINTTKQVFNCRGCSKGGDVIALVQHLDSCEFDKAVTTLAGERPRTNGAAKPNDKADGSKQPGTATSNKPELVASYDYTDAEGRLLFQVHRLHFNDAGGKPNKTFRQRRPDPENPKQWIWGLAAGDYMRKTPGQDWYRFNEARWATLSTGRERKHFPAARKGVPYRLPELLEAIANERQIFIVEGEGKVNALAAWNLRATCNAEGAGKWTAEHAAYLRGADVIVLPDNDDAGLKHAEAVARSLQGIASRIRVLNLPLEPKGDVVDWARAGGTREQLDGLVEQAKQWIPQPTSPPGRIHQQITLKSARASTFEMSAIQWIWPNRFALGKLGILGGLPDQGKGQILADMAARVTRGLEWPCSEGRAPQGNVLLLTAEDDPKDTVVPRLVAAGADLDRVEIISMVNADNKDRMFSLMTDLSLLRQKIAEVGDVKMIQIDPISAYLGIGKIDSFRTTDVRAVLAPVVDLAAEHMVAIVGIMHFNKKTDITNAMLRISDSLAFVATARHCYVVVNDDGNDRKLFVKAKNNLAPDTKAMAYGFGLREVGIDQKTKQPIRAPHIVWHPQYVDVTTSEAMEAAASSKSPAARDSAKKFLANMLAHGPVSKQEIEEAAEANCISERTLWRAKDDLHIVAKKDGLKGGWTWQLPDQTPNWHDDR
jgi:putative DNA primase/helicase